MNCRLLLCLLAVLTATALSDPHQVRRWTGKNGKSFNGAYMGVDKASGKYEFALDNGKSYLVDPNNISEEDIEWLEGELNPAAKPNPSVGDPIDFLPDPDMDRTLLPVIDQSDYGSKASDCVPSSFCNFLLWWDDRRYLPIDKKGDLIMHTWGTRIRGRLAKLKQDGVMRRGALHFTSPKYAIELINQADFPEWMIENEVSFQIDPLHKDGLTVIAPYRFKEPGKKSPPPPDPIMDPKPRKPSNREHDTRQN